MKIGLGKGSPTAVLGDRLKIRNRTVLWFRSSKRVNYGLCE